MPMFYFKSLAKQKLIKQKCKGSNPETQKILSLLDLFTVKLVLYLPKEITKETIHQREEFRRIIDSDIETSTVNVGWEKRGGGFEDWAQDPDVKTLDWPVTKKFACTTLDEDDFYGKKEEGLLKKVVTELTKMVFPVSDRILEVSSDEVAAQLLQDLELNEGRGMPKSYNKDFDMQSDESFSRIFFYGIGAPLLAAQEKVSEEDAQKFGPFQVDMPIHHLKVRKGFRRYGARVHFNADQLVTGIFDYAKEKMFQPNDPEWDKAKCLAKVTTMVIATVQEHLICTHLIVASTATVQSTIELSPSHPIRRLLTIFTFRSTEVNNGAFKILVPKNMLLHRGTGLEYSAIQELFDSSYSSSIAFQPFSRRDYIPELIKLSNENKFPYIDQGEAYYEIVQSFVRRWLKFSGDKANDEQALNFYNGVKESTKGQAYVIPDYRSQDDMVQVLSQIIFSVTAYHELVGTVVDYSCLPNRAGFRVSNDEKKTDIQAFLIQALITSTTSIEMPLLMDPFDKFFGAGGAPAWETDVWKKFREDLGRQSRRVQADDRLRNVEFKTFDPDHFECSVSV